MLEAVIFLMICLVEYAFQTKKEDFNLSVFNIITGINVSKTSLYQWSLYHANENVNLMVEKR